LVGESPDSQVANDLRACALHLEQLALEAEYALPGALAGIDARPADLWPVLRFEPGHVDHTYVNDYALIVAMGGDNRYRNNAGGNLLDVTRGPAGSPALEKGPARGCQSVRATKPDQQVLSEIGRECVVSAALVLDLGGGDNVYGTMEAPDPRVDGLCTKDPVVRRMVTDGAGLVGVGILIERGRSAHFVGKTLSVGAGHGGGVGILRHEGGGHASYSAIRSSEGFGMVSGVGLLVDDAGVATYDYYVPRALDPGARVLTPGSGGIVDDVGLCDNLSGDMQGTGLLGGIGVLWDADGSHHFRAPDPVRQEELPGVFFDHSSQGYGVLGGLGVLFDQGQKDTYQGIPGRTAGSIVGPRPGDSGLSLFVDMGR
jgi:hypothetical protein